MSNGYRYNHVLLIENLEIDNYIACHLLEKYSLARTITIKKSGPEGLEFLGEIIINEQQLPDLIIMDMQLPGMNGIECLKKMEEFPHEIKSQLKIIAVSSIIEKEEIEQIKKSPLVHQFIPKPLSIEVITKI
jgi:CheY-like chemotaxis protein